MNANDETRRPSGPEEPEPLTAEERAAFDALPRERDPGRFLEERTVRALRERGLLEGGPGAARGPGRRERRFRGWRLAGAAAAAALLFASGLSVGQWMGARQTRDAVQAAFGDRPLEEAARVQRAGSEYVSALAALAERPEEAGEREQGVEVALTALWAAANEIVRLAPEDPLAARILQEFERARSESGERRDGQVVVWF